MFDVTTYILARSYTNTAIAESGGGSKEIEIETTTGQLPAETLAELIDKDSAVVKLDGKIYRLARIENNDYKYLNSTTNGEGQTINMTELNIDKITGDFYTKQIIIEGSSVQWLEDELLAHINNNNVHITATERNY